MIRRNDGMLISGRRRLAQCYLIGDRALVLEVRRIPGVDGGAGHSRRAEQHATAIEELQSTNEELETTNEELQSTNEELETTNEELQSTNEELETTVEELQAANTELGALNSELEGRTAELNRLDAYHRSFVNSLEYGVVVLDRQGVVTTWNEVAEHMWGLRGDQAVGRPFFALPIGEVAQRAQQIFSQVVASGKTGEVRDVPFTRPGGSASRGVLRMMPLRDAASAVAGTFVRMLPADR